MRTVLGIVGRYLLVYLINVLALLLATSILPGFRLDTSDPRWWTVLLTVPIEFAVLLILLRPLLLLLTLPLNSLTLGLPTLLFNGVILYLLAHVEHGFIVENLLHAFIGLTVLTVITTSAVGWLGIDEAYPFFQSMIYRLGRRFGPPRQRAITHGVVILQIDGLSRRSLQVALERGRMPTISGLLARGGHRLYRWRSGLPSNTPAVQAGLLYGSRQDSPGYRWYDREARRVRVASTPEDLRILERRAAESGQPLLAGGSCINSFLSGGAAKRLVTLSAQGEPDSARRKGELADFNLFWLSPFAYAKALISSFWDLGSAVFWVLAARFGSRPRLRTSLRRLAQRMVANAFLRETASFWIKQDIVRGVPVIYSNFVGYDEVAHYSGPETYQAQVTLSGFDRKLHRLVRLMRHGAPIAYDLVLLSDHGQTVSTPFRLVYGRKLDELLAELLGGETPVVDIPPLESIQLGVLLRDLHESRAGERAWAAARGRRTLERFGGPEPSRRLSVEEAAKAVVVCVSGCLAHIYFTHAGRRLTLFEIRQAYPGLVEGLASHPGIGFIVAIREGGRALAIGKDAVRDLETGRVLGRHDPLAPFGEPDVWTRELRRLAAGASSGDLIVNGAMREGRLMVFEDQLSSHGGLGGEQTEPFLVVPTAWNTRPADLVTPEALHDHLLGAIRRAREDGAGPTAA